MNKPEFIAKYAETYACSKAESGQIIDNLLGLITDILAEGEAVKFIGFGSFEPKKRNAKNGINPSTKEKIVIPGRTVPVFKASKAFKEAVAQGQN